MGRLWLSIVLTLIFVLVETVAGIQAHSLSLLADAGHNFTDGLALMLSWWAMTLAKRPPSSTRTFGYHRAGILAALVNSITLILISVAILREGYLALVHPHQVSGNVMMVVAAAALLMNSTIALWIRGDAKHSLNMRIA